MFFILFFIIGIFFVLSGGNFFIYITLVKMFDVGPRGRIFLLYIFGFLSISFFLSSVLLYNFQVPFFKIYYLFSALWIGISFYLMQFSVIAWLIWIFANFWDIRISNRALGLFVLAGALAISVYGVYNTQKIIIKEIRVGVRGLPEAWQDKTALQITDAHLGAINGIRFSKNIAAAANKVKPDVVFITGDLYDGTLDNNSAQISPLDGISAPDGIYMVSGNHENYVGMEKVGKELENTKIRLIDDEILILNGVQLAGIGYPVNEQPKNYDSYLEKINPDLPAILLYHSPDLKEIKSAIKYGVDLQLSGHTHRGQLFPANFITGLIFQGLDYGLHTFGDFSIYTSCGVGTWGPPMKTTCRPEIIAIKFFNLR